MTVTNSKVSLPRRILVCDGRPSSCIELVPGLSNRLIGAREREREKRERERERELRKRGGQGAWVSRTTL